MPAPDKKAERTKVLSVRLTDDEFAALTARATQVGVGPSTLARTFVRQALAGCATAASPPTSGQVSRLEQHLAEHLEVELTASLSERIEALERWVRDHDGRP